MASVRAIGEQEANKILNEARYVQPIGPRRERYLLTRFVGASIKIGFAGAILLGGYNVLTSNDNKSELQTVSIDESASDKPTSKSSVLDSVSSYASQAVDKVKSTVKVGVSTLASVGDSFGGDHELEKGNSVAPHASTLTDASESNISDTTQIIEKDLKSNLASLGLGSPGVKVVNKLPFEVSQQDDHYDMVNKLYNNKMMFEAASLQVEGLRNKPYYIEGNADEPTIGVGYNIKKSIGAVGKDKVTSELSSSGIDDKNITYLLSRDKSISSQAFITNLQAINLLKVSAKRFEASTSSAIGLNVWKKLPHHRQVALMMLDYHANIRNYPNVIDAVRSGDTVRAIDNMNSFIKMGKSARKLNVNMAVAQAVYFSPKTAHGAVMDPEMVKRNFRNGSNPWPSINNQSSMPNTAYASNNSNQSSSFASNSSSPTKDIQNNSVRVTHMTAGTEIQPRSSVENTNGGDRDAFLEAKRRHIQQRAAEGYSISEIDTNSATSVENLSEQVISNTNNNLQKLRDSRSNNNNNNSGHNPRRSR